MDGISLDGRKLFRWTEILKMDARRIMASKTLLPDVEQEMLIKLLPEICRWTETCIGNLQMDGNCLDWRKFFRWTRNALWPSKAYSRTSNRRWFRPLSIPP